MPEEQEPTSPDQQLVVRLIEALRDPNVRAKRTKGAVDGVNLVVIIVLLVYQVVVVPTKTEMGSIKTDVGMSATKADLEKVVTASQRDIDGIRTDVQALKIELREAVRHDVPTWLTDRLQLLETDVRTLRGSSRDDGK